jgi:poly(beta-D-mannuronate) lyase
MRIPAPPGGARADLAAGLRSLVVVVALGALSCRTAVHPVPAAVAVEGCRRTLSIGDSGALASALAGARPGDCLMLADGQFVFPAIGAHGTAEAPILVRAAHRGQAVVSSGSIALRGAAYVTLDGLDFTSSGNISFHDVDHCRLTRSRIHPDERRDVDWVDIEGRSHHVRIDHDDFGPKKVMGNMLMLGGTGGQVVQYNQIDHNYFHDIQYGGGNGWETIRMGLSFLAPSKGFNTIELNLFRATAGDPETISIKSSDNVLRYNTLRFNPGELVLRHGNRNQVYGNYILGEGNAKAGGIRVCGADHRIYNNYVADVKSGAAIFLEGGDGDGTDVPGKQHYRVYRTQVVNNTVVGGRIQIGGAHPLEPIDCTVANNLVQGEGIVEAAGKGTRYAGNIVSAGPPRDAREVRVAAQLALVQVGDLWKLSAGSPAVDASATGFDYVTDDIDGQRRDHADVGADELSTAPVAHRPLVEADVGLDAP